MPLIEIKLPAGMYKNGTPNTRKGRWEDGNLVRWHDGSIRPIGGWLRRQTITNVDIASVIADASLEAVRDIFTWRSLSQATNMVLGSNLALYHVSASGVVTNITYVGYTARNSTKDASVQAGYGQGAYGLGAYGVANNLTGQDPNPPDRWYFDNFGELLLTGVRQNGTIYELDLATLTLSGVTNAPSVVQDLCVTDQRQVFVIGGEGEPRRVQASDIENRTDWTPVAANQAIDRTLAGTGKLLRAVNVLRQILILGESDAHVARYIGPPYIYSIELAGENCGPRAAEAVARTDRFAVWWGSRSFWLYDGSVQQLPCTVMDFLHDDINPVQESKITTFTVTDYSEVWWLYQSNSSATGELDSYVSWNYVGNHWTTGRLNRTAGVDATVTQSPVLITPTGELYNHEQDSVIPDGDVYVQSGPMQLGAGDKNMAVRYIYPDTEATGDVSFTLIGRQLPNATEHTYGPYAYQQQAPIPTRALARDIILRVDLDNANAELGVVRFDLAPVGTGRR